MAILKQLVTKIKKGPQDIVALDFDPSGVKCVRMKKANGDLSVAAADILPPVDINSASHPTLYLPKNLVARYVSICLSGENAVVKLLNLPGQLEGDAEAQIKEHMGIGGGEYRIGYRMVSHGHGRSETKLLTVAIPDAEAQAACALFSLGWPVPISIELSGLAAMTAFLHGPGQIHKEEAIGVIESEARVTFVAFFNKGELMLIRKFDSGHYDLLDKIRKSLGVDHETAKGIISEGSFDISQLVKEVSEPFIKQLVISKHFVERRENCQIAKLFVPSGAGVSHDWLDEIKSAVGLSVDCWNPFEGIAVAPNALPQQYEGQPSRFAAAVGAVLGAFEETSAG